MRSKFYFIHEFVCRHRAILALCIVPFVLFAVLLWSFMLRQDDTGLWAGHPYVWADWSFHSAMVSHFAYKPVALWFSTNPILSGEPLRYTFVTNLISAILVRFGTSLPAAMIVPSLLFSLAFPVCLSLFFTQVLQKKRMSIVAFWIFLCAGGLGFFIALRTTSLATILSDSSLILTQRPDDAIEFTTFWMGLFVPQRAFLLGAPIGFALLIVVYRLWVSKVSPRTLTIAGIVAGTLPIIHTHTFIAIALVSLTLATLSYPKWRLWMRFGIPATVISLFLFKVFISTGMSQSFVAFAPGWYAGESIGSWIYFWWVNWGLFLPLAVFGTYLVARTNRKLAGFVLPFWFLFLLANLIRFQPQTWDNSKLFVWAHLGLTIPVVYCVEKLFERTSLRIVGGFLIFVVLSSGAIDLLHMLDRTAKSHVMLSRDEILIGNYVRDHTDPAAIILTADSVTNPITMISGRSIVMGYSGWVFSHGFDYGQREKDIALMYGDSPQAQVLREGYGIDYVFIGNAEKKYNPVIAPTYTAVFSNPAGSLYKVND